RLAFKRKRAGYRMIYKFMRKAGWRINHKKVYRLYSREGLKIRTKPRKKRKLADSKPIPIPTQPNEVWAIDFLHERTIDGRKARILSGVDLCTRENVVLSADYSISSERLIRFLESLPALPKSFVTDNGPEFTSRVFINWLSKNNIGISYIDLGKPTQNAFVESFNGKLRSECLQLSFCRDLNELKNELSKFQKDYNEERLHSSLNYLTPLEFKAKYGN
ncbi:IS3 family transposase, partial [Leptospira soteropolitanensis]